MQRLGGKDRVSLAITGRGIEAVENLDLDQDVLLPGRFLGFGVRCGACLGCAADGGDHARHAGHAGARIEARAIEEGIGVPERGELGERRAALGRALLFALLPGGMRLGMGHAGIGILDARFGRVLDLLALGQLGVDDFLLLVDRALEHDLVGLAAGDLRGFFLQLPELVAALLQRLDGRGRRGPVGRRHVSRRPERSRDEPRHDRSGSSACGPCDPAAHRPRGSRPTSHCHDG